MKYSRKLAFDSEYIYMLTDGLISSHTAFLALQLSLGLAILLQLHPYSQILGTASLILVGTYPLFKRFTYWVSTFRSI